MTSEWKIAPLGEIARNVSRAFNFKNKDNVVFINTGDVLNGEFLHFNKSSVKGLPGQAKKAIANKDILYSEIRPGNKRYVFVRDCFTDDIVVSTKFMVLETKGPVIPEYLYLVLTSQECESEFKIIADSRSGTFPQITFDSVSHYPIKYPLKSIQKKIFEFDGALTSRIKINNDINQTLEQMAQALFKSWFVDFEPVKAQIAVLEAGGSQEDVTLAAMTAISGKDADALAVFEREHPEQYAELKTTAELFPSAMQDSELGEIPEGWGVSTIGESYSIVMGQSPKGETYNVNGEGALFFQGRAEFGWRYPSPRLFTTDPKRMADKGSILLSVRAPVGDLNIALNSCCIGRGLSSLLHKSMSTSFSYYQLKNLANIFTRFNGEGTVFGSINQKDLKSIKVIFAKDAVVSSFAKTICSLDEMIENKSKEILDLQQLRDTLLPKLLSGEITLPEAEQIISEEA